MFLPVVQKKPQVIFHLTRRFLEARIRNTRSDFERISPRPHHQEQAGAGIAFGEQVFALPESSPGGSPHQSLQFRSREVREQRSFPENCSTVAADAQTFNASSYPRLLPHHTSGSYRLSSAARVAALFLLEIPRANGFASPERSGSKYRITI